MRISVISLGCEKNLTDAEAMLGMLERNGYEIMENEEDSEVVIVNTCCFINDAKQESIDTILEVAKLKNEGKCKKIIVTGCMAMRYKDEILKEMPEVDAVLGMGEYDRLLEVIKSNDKLVMCDKPFKFLNEERILTTPPYTAYIKIADGCDNRCTYCVIPSLRGGFLSRPMEDIIAEAEKIVKDGAKELVLIAQDTTNYGIDIYKKPALAELMQKLCRIDDLKWLRVLYCYPERITDELIDVIASEDKICKYIDMPIQHCNDEVLKRMGRKGTKESIVDVINKLRNKIPGITLRTTLIAGFPGETEEQYTELEEFIKEIRFERLGVFTYSCEEGTPAAAFTNQIDEEEKVKRRDMLMLIQADIAAEISESKIGTVQKVLVEGYDEIIKQYYGRTEADTSDVDGKVFIKSQKQLAEGSFVFVMIENCYDYDLFGTVKEEEI